MKRTDLIRRILGFGCVPVTDVSQAVPRHREIEEPLARQIIKMLKSE